MIKADPLAATGSSEMTCYEHELLTDPSGFKPGAAFNACWEFCLEEGWMLRTGAVTPKGQKAIEAYEARRDQEDEGVPAPSQ